MGIPSCDLFGKGEHDSDSWCGAGFPDGAEVDDRDGRDGREGREGNTGSTGD